MADMCTQWKEVGDAEPKWNIFEPPVPSQKWYYTFIKRP